LHRYSNFLNTIAAVSAAAIDLSEKPAARYHAIEVTLMTT
jgi:hypothetical protein